MIVLQESTNGRRRLACEDAEFYIIWRFKQHVGRSAISYTALVEELAKLATGNQPDIPKRLREHGRHQLADAVTRKTITRIK